MQISWYGVRVVYTFIVLQVHHISLNKKMIHEIPLAIFFNTWRT
jgi:hypothetical protein